MTDPQRPPSGKDDKDPSSNARRSQTDIGLDTQTGLARANAKDDDQPQGPGQPGEPRPPLDSPEEKATQFDGNPNQSTDESSGLFKPHDDTPGFLEKKSGPRN
ncbi:hypothetical protein [Bordetella genomosp. 13]|uniref:hypothetical protein n=1 Tax=Bordetella genomosp. 13 TaxID=463040 RepID=UPI0011A35D0A|nr:hypothetical protein [Bordetella genomosp. 13]